MLRAVKKRRLIMPSLQVPPTRKVPRRHSKDVVDTVGNLDPRQPIVPAINGIKIRARKPKQQKKRQHGKGDLKGKGHLDMSKIKCFNCGEYGHFAHDCIILLKKVSRSINWNLCWIWIVLVYVKSV